jgi:hypothetical protein
MTDRTRRTRYDLRYNRRLVVLTLDHLLLLHQIVQSFAERSYIGRRYMLKFIHVYHKFIAPCKRLAANLTDVRFLAGMDAHVDGELVFAGQPLPAHCAFECFQRGIFVGRFSNTRRRLLHLLERFETAGRVH